MMVFEGALHSLISSIKAFVDVTRAVPLLGMLSPNETVEEIATEDLKFLLLPAFLGSLTLRIEINRGLVLDAVEIYFMDYLKHCKEYDITNVKIPGRKEEKDGKY
ncbi:hypothetical protein J437_LFUL002573 [Ladona fulva]|uniref:Uncharacterized protein n=1 Tax=Ladona fulva TaxID=123851 RepID=A0A8K0JW73_LADFU|nr:hypothetical protein J437_LFUL002573 [Ladona fulva]